MGYDWPGNVRELENVIERAFIKRKEGKIQDDDIVFDVIGSKTNSSFQAHQTQKLWYEDGALPILTRDLSTLPNTKARRSLHYNARRPDVYSETFPYLGHYGHSQSKQMLIYLIPENVHYFFKNTFSEHYKKLMRKIRENEFNKIPMKPFKVYNTSLLISDLNIFATRHEIRKIVESGGAHVVAFSDREIYFVISEDNVEAFFTEGSDRNQKIEALLAEIRDHYKRFQQWTPIPR